MWSIWRTRKNSAICCWSSTARARSAARSLWPRRSLASGSLRAALQETLRDDRFLIEAQKQNLPLDLVSAAEAEEIIKSIYSTPLELAKQVKAVLE